eukprot:1674518-Karenia_brevis.AAC.1
MFPVLKKRLQRPWDALKSWRSRMPTSHRTPITEELLRAMFIYSLERGFGSNRCSFWWFCFAVLIRIGFFALLRPGELTQLRREDVGICDDPTGTKVAVLIIRQPKNRASLGMTQCAVVRDACSVRWLEWFIQGVPNSCKLWISNGA